jgi:hypothetical protein
MLRKTFAIALLALASFSCESNSVSAENEVKLVAFKPNQCSEPWDDAKYTTNESLSRADRLKNYLKDSGIGQITNFAVTTDNNAYCAACTCPSSDNIKFTVSLSDFEKLKTVAPFSTYLK